MGKEREVQVMVAVLDVCRSTSAAITSWCLAALWRRLRGVGLPRRRCRTYALGTGGFNYDPLSYAQNFDDGSLGDCEPDFTARTAEVKFARQAAQRGQGAVASGDCDLPSKQGMGALIPRLLMMAKCMRG